MMKDFICKCIVKPCVCVKAAPIKKSERDRDFFKRSMKKPVNNTRRSFGKGIKR